ncbi:MAG: CPBP family intramembrane metalloprotease [Gemmatimonadetes bacterium]|nr:CPBP family intramembrane metalloprotease [Gemmatimonadota bacterium]
MFDLSLFLLLSALAVAAIVIALPRHVTSLLRLRGETAVPVRLVKIGATFQQSLMAVGLVAAGTWAAPRVGLEAPWFSAILRGEGLGLSYAVAQLPAALILGGLGTAAFLWLYYRIFRPRMAAEAVSRTEELRNSMGLVGRLAMGGVAEELMFRWGVMSVLAWLVISVGGLPSVLGMWVAIVVSGVLFGVGHLPGVAAAGISITRVIVAAAVVLNGLVALVFGWLFWQYGLLAAIVAHALVHAFWHPLERPRTRVNTR